MYKRRIKIPWMLLYFDVKLSLLIQYLSKHWGGNIDKQVSSVMDINYIHIGSIDAFVPKVLKRVVTTYHETATYMYIWWCYRFSPL